MGRTGAGSSMASPTKRYRNKARTRSLSGGAAGAGTTRARLATRVRDFKMGDLAFKVRGVMLLVRGTFAGFKMEAARFAARTAAQDRAYLAVKIHCRIKEETKPKSKILNAKIE